MEQDLLLMGANALRKAALNNKAKEYILSDATLYKAIKKAADRYIGGETLDETILKVKHENKNGFKCSMEFMYRPGRVARQRSQPRSREHLPHGRQRTRLRVRDRPALSRPALRRQCHEHGVDAARPCAIVHHAANPAVHHLRAPRS